MVWEPKTCCCGASVKTGTLILGWLGLIGYVLQVLSFLRCVALSRSDFMTICHNVSVSTEVNIDPEICADSIIGTIISGAMICLVGAAICGSLLWGVTKYKPVMMLPYLICKVIGLGFLGMMILVIFIVLCYYGIVLPAFIFVIISGLVMFLDVYFFLIVRVCYKEVKQHSMAMSGGNNIAYVEQRDITYKI